MLSPRRDLGVALLVALLVGLSATAAPARLNLLFLGDNAGHRPAERFRQLAPLLKKRGIDLTYTDKLSDLNPTTLGQYDGLVIYANHTRIAPEQEEALLDFVASGKGLIPLHCASYCFLNSPAYIALVGAQFRSHETGTFRATLADVDHPILNGYKGFSSWDETYVHHKHNEKDRTVLEYRVEGAVKEPWTWVRTHGKGRVFYTAWGHDHRTWGNPGFVNLVERGIRWACGGDPSVVPPYVDAPEMTKLARDLPPFQYKDAKVPFYPAGERWGTTGKPLTKMQLPLTAKESMRHMVTPVDFELQLFADETLFQGKPICMNWDERGRLWLALTYDYPNELQPAGKGRDRIVIVEDTTGDGVADKVTTFADKLSIPTSIAFYDGGVIVHQAPHTLYLKDTTGDGVADLRRTLFTGWGTNDTHAGPSNLNYGLDNWLYGIVGYAGFRGQVGGERHSFGQGFYRFKPDGSKLEFLRSTNNNSWGVGFSEEGLLFGSTANGNPSEYLPVPNRYYESVRGWSSSVLRGIAGNAPMHPITDKVRQVDYHGRFTAAAGHALYTARTYPREYWNQTAFVCEPTGHLVATFQLQPDGSNFRSRNAWNLLASDDEWCAPIMAEVGPDGHVWVLDWYNFIVQHNPTPAGYRTGRGAAYETELRDKKHGRVYRLVHKKAAPVKPLSLHNAQPAELVATLKHDNLFWRRHAQRLLVERGQQDVVPALIELVHDTSVDAIGLNPGAIHALWTLHGLGALEREAAARNAVVTALQHPSAGVRRNAALVLPKTTAAVDALLDKNLLNDDDPHVRLATLLALAEKQATDKAGPALAQALTRDENLADRWISDALTSAAAAHAPGFLVAVASLKQPLDSRAVPIVQTVSAHYAAGGPSDSIERLLQALGSSPATTSEAILAGLARGWKGKGPAKLSEETGKTLAKLLEKGSPTARANLLRLAAALGSKGLEMHLATVVKSLLETVENAEARESDRIAAAKQLIELQLESDEAVEQLLTQLTPRTLPGLINGILDAIALSQSSKAGQLLVDRLAEMTPTARAASIRVLLGRATSTKVLLDSIEQGKLQLSDLALDQKQALAAHPDKSLRARATKLLAKGGDLPSPDRQKVIEQLMPLLKQKGDATQGKVVFKNQCAKCHVHSGEGTAIGPDLTGMATHPKEELLIHIMDPSRSVEGNFRVYTVTTSDGKVFSGMLASESRTSIELIDTEAKRITLQRDDIEQLSGSSKSLMPEGFEKQLKEQELVDLLEFLTQKGKYLPLPLDKVATANSSQGMFYSKSEPGERLVFPDWKPKIFKDVPFHVVEPGPTKNNVVLLYGPQGTIPPTMPKSVTLPVNSSAKAIHLLSGISGWGHPLGQKGSVSMIIRLHYADGSTEDHELKNGQHFADYIRRIDVPGSTFAYSLRGRQVRYLAITPKREDVISKMDLVKGPDDTAPIVLAVTVETR